MKKEKNANEAKGDVMSGKRQELRTLYAETIPYLLQWYEYNRRILPWREEPTPYHVWVSEIMLQQTRVEAVKGYYDRFLTRLPDVKALANAEEEVLLKLWEGLGYYNRVRNMQKAAKILVEQYGGEMPADYEAIRALPGIGDYTAGAVSSIAFSLPYPAVDGNVLRVMSRIACNEEDIAKEQTKKKLKEDLTSVMPKESGDFNQALMELGATVCLPNGKPLCEQCPVMHLCKAFHEGKEMQLPVKSGKKERRIEHRKVYVLSYGEKVVLHRREGKGLLAGLWEFPNRLITEETEQDNFEGTIVRTQKAKHIFSHVEWHMEGIWIQADGGENGTPGPEELEERLLKTAQYLTERELKQEISREDWVVASFSELQEKYPIPSAFEAFLKELRKGDNVCESGQDMMYIGW